MYRHLFIIAMTLIKYVHRDTFINANVLNVCLMDKSVDNICYTKVFSKYNYLYILIVYT